MISISCSGCRKKYRVPDEAVGKRAKCSECGAIIKISPPPSPMREWTEKMQGRFALTKAGCALRRFETRLNWSGKEGSWTRDLHVARPWRILWAVQGGYTSSFWLSVYEKGESNAILTPARESDIEAMKEGVKDIHDVGSLSLEVVADGYDQMRWLVVVQDIRSG